MAERGFDSKTGSQQLSAEAQGHIATQARVFSLVDHTHPTAAELLCDFVVGDGLVDHVSSQIDYRNELR